MSFLAFCSLKFCQGRNTIANNSNSQELTVDEKAGDVIFWTITGQMYHIREKCPIHRATLRDELQEAAVCQVCNSDFGAPIYYDFVSQKFKRGCEKSSYV